MGTSYFKAPMLIKKEPSGLYMKYKNMTFIVDNFHIRYFEIFLLMELYDTVIEYKTCTFNNNIFILPFQRLLPRILGG